MLASCAVVTAAVDMTYSVAVDTVRQLWVEEGRPLVPGEFTMNVYLLVSKEAAAAAAAADTVADAAAAGIDAL